MRSMARWYMYMLCFRSYSMLLLLMICVAQLKVSLRPISSPASEALSSLAQRFGDVVWDIVFLELQQPLGAHQTPDWMTTIEDDGSDMDPWEEEQSWRDPSAHRLCSAAVNWFDRHHQCKIIISVRLVTKYT